MTRSRVIAAWTARHAEHGNQILHHFTEIIDGRRLDDRRQIDLIAVRHGSLQSIAIKDPCKTVVTKHASCPNFPDGFTISELEAQALLFEESSVHNGLRCYRPTIETYGDVLTHLLATVLDDGSGQLACAIVLEPFPVLRDEKGS